MRHLLLISLVILSIGNTVAFSEPQTLDSSQNIVSLDANRDNKITYESIANGSDDIFLRMVNKNEINKDQNYFTDDKNNYYLPLTYQDLRKADSNSDRRIDSKDPIYASLFIARISPGVNKRIIAIALLKDSGIKALVLPAAIPDPVNKNTHIQAVTKDGDLVLVESVPWK